MKRVSDLFLNLYNQTRNFAKSSLNTRVLFDYPSKAAKRISTLDWRKLIDRQLLRIIRSKCSMLKY